VGRKKETIKPKSDPDTITQMRHKRTKEIKEKHQKKNLKKEKEILLSLYPPMLYPTIRATGRRSHWSTYHAN